MDPRTIRHHRCAMLLPMLPDAELVELAEDIKKNGLRVPVVVMDVGGEWQLLDGRNRARACEMADVLPSHTIWSGDDAIAFVLSANIHRRHLDTSQRAMVGVEAERLYSEQSMARKRSAGAAQGHRGAEGGRGKKKPVPANLPDGVSPSPAHEKESRERAAALVNVSGRTMQAAKKVAAAGAEGVVTAVRAGKIAVDDAVKIVSLPAEKQASLLATVESGAAKTLKEALAKSVKADVVAGLAAEPTPLPAGPFRIIVADPPWRYEKRADDATHRGANPYPDMSTEEICALPVGGIAHDDSILWLWTTNAFMRDAFRVLDAWGFQERTILTWVKNRMGTGDWLRGKTEHCILAIRGKPTVTLTNQTTELAAAMREHSRKPDEFYALVEALCPGSKIELFAREARTGWSAWGAEPDKFAKGAA
jgi:N6-adenosine-specific RNA methylase IME4/ParB-like chromosome segregation protein Spo0J